MPQVIFHDSSDQFFLKKAEKCAAPFEKNPDLKSIV